MKPLFFKKPITGALAALITWCAAIAVFSFISLRLDDPKKPLVAFSLIALIIGALIGGRFASESTESKTFSAFIASFSVLLTYIVMSLIIGKASGVSLSRAIIVFISAFAGAFITKGKHKNTSSRRIRKNVASKYASYQKN